MTPGTRDSVPVTRGGAGGRSVSTIWAATIIAMVLLGACSEEPPAPDLRPPDAIKDLTVAAVTETTATLTWSAPEDPSEDLPVASYDLRYSTAVLPAAWDSATVVRLPYRPRPAGQPEQHTVHGLVMGQVYFMALLSRDLDDQVSELSNVVQAHPGDPLSQAPTPGSPRGGRAFIWIAFSTILVRLNFVIVGCFAAIYLGIQWLAGERS